MVISRAAMIQLNDTMHKVFPLFGPIEEKRWAKGWNPTEILPDGAVFEENMRFKTRSDNPHEAWFYWELLRLSNETNEIQYSVKTPNRNWIIKIKCSETGTGSTQAGITYSYKAFNALGSKLNHRALSSMFKEDLKDWERAINHYLITGQSLKTDSDTMKG